jgi:membrane protein implicated in regulation of membrane protease activity
MEGELFMLGLAAMLVEVLGPEMLVVGPATLMLGLTAFWLVTLLLSATFTVLLDASCRGGSGEREQAEGAGKAEAALGRTQSLHVGRPRSKG